MTTSKRYILIDDLTGFVWGDTVAADPVAACRAIDEALGETDRQYEDIGRCYLRGTETGYHVHVVPADFPVDLPPVTDGQDEATIAMVEALPIATRVLFSSAEG